jgi:hypothetical protein
MPAEIKRGLGDNHNPIEEALYKKLEEAQELILKSITKTDEMHRATKLNGAWEDPKSQFIFTEECFDLKEESADICIDAANKIGEVLSEVKREK